MQPNIASSTSSLRGRQWAETAALLIHTQLSDETDSSVFDLAPCGHETVSELRRAADPSVGPAEARRILKALEIASEDRLKAEFASHASIPLHSRRLYTDCRLLHSIVDLRDPVSTISSSALWKNAVSRLDMAIIVAGAPGDGRLDLIHDTIKTIQAEHIPAKNRSRGDFNAPAAQCLPPISGEPPAPNPIPRLSPPSLSAFRKTFSSAPFILPGFISEWPALTNRPWCSPSYLRQVAGPGRIVPVEIGSDYRAAEWGQSIMPWEEVLRCIGMESIIDLPIDASEKTGCETEDRRVPEQVIYLAQHTLLTQFPALRSDIVIPDYVYASLPPLPTCSTYRPPGNNEQLVINAWLGPKGTVSPAHTDPYFNCYAQVVGRKTVWLAPPRLQDEMYPFLGLSAPHIARCVPSSPDDSTSEAHITPLLTNTSRVDVFAPPPCVQFPRFDSHVRPHALCAVLQPGDLLYVPLGWWHAMRSEDISFSVSMWF